MEEKGKERKEGKTRGRRRKKGGRKEGRRSRGLRAIVLPLERI